MPPKIIVTITNIIIYNNIMNILYSLFFLDDIVYLFFNKVHYISYFFITIYNVLNNK